MIQFSRDANRRTVPLTENFDLNPFLIITFVQEFCFKCRVSGNILHRIDNRYVAHGLRIILIGIESYRSTGYALTVGSGTPALFRS